MSDPSIPVRSGRAEDATEPLEEPRSNEVSASEPTIVIYCDGHLDRMRAPEGGEWVVGRSAPATWVIPDPKLSREHARVTRVGDGLRVTDLGSRNGTWRNGARVDGLTLSFGEEVTLGRTVLRWRGPGPIRPAASPEVFVAGPNMSPLLADVIRLAAAHVPVVLHGETGTGKEVLAQLLHEKSPRSEKPFLRVNCAAIPAQLVEATLFGHERGAFTGAHQRQRGVFEESDGGTLFLDEIGELGLAAQASMLRVLESGTFSRVGSQEQLRVDVRVIAATHRSLSAMVEAGTFRADLYFRLNTVTLVVPPLRARRSDIEPISRTLLAQAGRGAGAAGPRAIAVAAMEQLEQHGWPGNVRELKNAIDRAVALASGPTIGPRDLLAHATHPMAGASHAPTPEAEPVVESEGGVRDRVSQYEVTLIEEALRTSGGNKTEAARALGLPIRTLSRRIKQLKIQTPGED